MRLIIFLVVLFPTICFAQDSLVNIISKDFCNCLSKSKAISQKYLDSCFGTAMNNNLRLIADYLETASTDTSAESDRKAGKELSQKILVNMVYSCKSYYVLADTLRYSYMRTVNKDSIRNAIKTMSATDSKNWNMDFYTERGVMYFELMELDNALKDFDNAIQLSQQAFQSMYFKAWVLELKKKYDESIALYKKVAELTGRENILITAAIVARKKTGK